ncbi:hypothetical protein [Argonema antarcticum]|uniref:hypothetical protein n=1 Tax=Argonema antarcticum TaxID=2942763 RepID=UPI0020126D5C|nr:hypothetical protein [Argonema antarcticum]MCL1474470.1 hypothetical protein [Argonema antarcticum A004/B2]
MSEQPKIPDAETRKRSLERLRESNRQLALVGLQIDELIAMADAHLLRQRRERQEGKKPPSANLNVTE